jgi:hypothetical protein
MTRNRVVDKEMYLVRLALGLFWDDNVTIIPEFDLVDTEHLVKQIFELYKSGVHTTVRNSLKSNLLLKSRFNRAKVKESSLARPHEANSSNRVFMLGMFLIDDACPLNQLYIPFNGVYSPSATFYIVLWLTCAQATSTLLAADHGSRG